MSSGPDCRKANCGQITPRRSGLAAAEQDGAPWVPLLKVPYVDDSATAANTVTPDTLPTRAASGSTEANLLREGQKAASNPQGPPPTLEEDSAGRAEQPRADVADAPPRRQQGGTPVLVELASWKTQAKTLGWVAAAVVVAILVTRAMRRDGIDDAEAGPARQEHVADLPVIETANADSGTSHVHAHSAPNVQRAEPHEPRTEIDLDQITRANYGAARPPHGNSIPADTGSASATAARQAPARNVTPHPISRQDQALSPSDLRRGPVSAPQLPRRAAESRLPSNGYGVGYRQEGDVSGPDSRSRSQPTSHPSQPPPNRGEGSRPAFSETATRPPEDRTTETPRGRAQRPIPTDTARPESVNRLAYPATDPATYLYPAGDFSLLRAVFLDQRRRGARPAGQASIPPARVGQLPPGGREHIYSEPPNSGHEGYR